MIFFVKVALTFSLLSQYFAMLAISSDSDSESGTLIPINRRPPLQRMVRDHHLDAAKAHTVKGIQLSTEALRRGADRSVDLNLHALVNTVDCGIGEAALKTAQSRRTSMAGLAGCLNASVASATNTIKHLYKAYTQPKKVQTLQQHSDRVTRDNHHLRNTYGHLSDQIQYISEHH